MKADGNIVNFKFEDGSNVFFTSDTHFSHDNIIRFCNRPFKDIHEMDETMIKNWNDVVNEDSVVFHLGDFAFGGSQVWNDTLKRLKGHKILIIGNHDRKNMREGYMRYFDAVSSQMEIYIEGRHVYLNHYPFLTYGGMYRGRDQRVWQLYGHVHTTPSNYQSQDAGRVYYTLPEQYDVGVDLNNFTPISWPQVKDIINKRIDEFEQNINI